MRYRWEKLFNFIEPICHCRGIDFIVQIRILWKLRRVTAIAIYGIMFTYILGQAPNGVCYLLADRREVGFEAGFCLGMENA